MQTLGTQLVRNPPAKNMHSSCISLLLLPLDKSATVATIVARYYRHDGGPLLLPLQCSPQARSSVQHAHERSKVAVACSAATSWLSRAHAPRLSSFNGVHVRKAVIRARNSTYCSGWAQGVMFGTLFACSPRTTAMQGRGMLGGVESLSVQ